MSPRRNDYDRLTSNELIPLAAIVGEWWGLGKAAGGGKLQIPKQPTAIVGRARKSRPRFNSTRMSSQLSSDDVRLISKYVFFSYAKSPFNSDGWLAPWIRRDMTRCVNSLSKSARRRAYARSISRSGSNAGRTTSAATAQLRFSCGRTTSRSSSNTSSLTVTVCDHSQFAGVSDRMTNDLTLCGFEPALPAAREM